MFKVGDKIMVHGYEEWGEGEIIKEHHSNYGDLYVVYFSDKDVSLTSCSQNSFYQILEQQITSNLTASSIIREIAKNTTNKGNIEFELKNGNIIRTIQDNDNTYRSSGWGLTSDFGCIDEIDINKFFKNMTIKGDFEIMPKITNYTYNEDTAVTTIKWSDGTKTTVRAENPDTADPHTGFMAAYAKKAAGNNNTINNLYDEWAIKKPAREQKAQIEANAVALEEQRILKKRKAKKEKWLIRKRAAEIAKEYEAKKLAHEKYGVPIDKNIEDENKIGDD